MSGNGCLVKISENSGMIEVMGNGCHVVVKRGCGRVIYTGNGGLVEAAPGVEVTYEGCAGQVMDRRKNSGEVKAVRIGKNVINVFNENGKHVHLPYCQFVSVPLHVKKNVT